MLSFLEVYDSSGRLLVNTEEISLGLIRSGRMVDLPTKKSPTYGAGHYCLSIPNAVSPIMFIEGPAELTDTDVQGNVTDMFMLPIFVRSSSTSLPAGWPPNLGSMPDPSTVRYYVFDHIRPGGETVGLELYNSQGKLTFNSNHIPLNIVKVVKPTREGAPNSYHESVPYRAEDGWSSGHYRPYSIYKSFGALGLTGSRYAVAMSTIRLAMPDRGNTRYMERVVTAKGNIIFLIESAGELPVQGDWRPHTVELMWWGDYQLPQAYVIDTSILPNNYSI